MCAVACVLIKQYRAEFAAPARISAVIAVLFVAIGLIAPIFQFLKDLMGRSLPLEYMEIIVKALGIAYLTHISAELCRDCGEGSIASAIEAVGRLEIIILSLPLLNKIITMSEELMLW